MEKFIHGLWGCFFGMTVVIFAGSWLAYARSPHRIALNAALTALISAFYATAFLGGLPVSDADNLTRFLTFFTALIAGFLSYQFLMTLSMLKKRGAKRTAFSALAVFCFNVLIPCGPGYAFVTRVHSHLKTGQKMGSI